MGTAVRKPARSQGTHAVCFCSHSQDDHTGGCQRCQCQQFQQRPCSCGHPASMHHGRCGASTEKGKCGCRAYSVDGTPEHFLRNGIRTGEWGFYTLPQLQALMRPDNTDRTSRVWACIAYHATLRQARGSKRNLGRMAIHILEDGRSSRPLLPDDILKELNALDSLARIDKHIVRKEIRELECRGLVRQVGATRKNIRILLYLRPLMGRKLPRFGGLDRPPNPPKSIETVDFETAVRIPIRSYAVKRISECLRQHPNLGVYPDPQTIIDEVGEAIDLVVCSALQKLGLGVWNDDVYKEDSISSSKEESCPPSSSSSCPEEETTTPKTRTSKTKTQEDAGPEAEFHQQLVEKFREAGKPLPIPKQSQAAFDRLGSHATEFLYFLHPAKLRRVQHPGALPSLIDEFELATAPIPQPPAPPPPAVCDRCQGSGLIGVRWTRIPEALAAVSAGAEICNCSSGALTKSLIEPVPALRAEAVGGAR